jgi:hypothetical protein
MLEATPGKPWGIGFKDLLDVEPNMKWRYVAQKAFCICDLTAVCTDGRLPGSTWRRTSTQLH